MRKIIALPIIILAVWGCVTFSPFYRLGNQAEMNKKWDEAIAYYEKAALEHPQESVYRLALFRVKTTASLVHLQDARRLAAAGKKEDAEIEYTKALNYDPLNRMIAEELRNLKSPEVKKPEPEQTSYEYPVKLKIVKEKVDLNFATEISLRSIFLALGKHFGVSILFEQTFQELAVTIDLRGREFEEAVNQLCLVTHHFYRIIDERTILIIPDKPEKRQQYNLTAIKTFYLSNIPAESIQTPLLLMLQRNFQQVLVTVDKNMNSLTIRDTPATLKMVERLLRIWDKPKAEVMLDVEIMEVSRVKLRKLGLDFDKNTLSMRYVGTGATTTTDGTSSQGWVNLSQIDFSKSGNFEVSLPTSLLQFLEQDSDTKMIAQPRLRGLHEEDIKYVVGQKVPFTNSQFSPMAAGGVAYQPVTNYTQQDVGIDIKIKPRIHREKEVTLDVDIKITSIAGKGAADIPILSSREVKNVMRLKDGETNLLAGLLKDEERKSLKGIPMIKDIPLLGRLFSSEDTTLEQTDVILTITPYIIRTVPVGPDDSKLIWMDLEGASLGVAGGMTQIIPDEEMIVNNRMIRPGEDSGARGGNQISLSPTNFEVPRKREFRMTVNVLCEQPVSNMAFNVNFNPMTVKLNDVLEGGFIRQSGEKTPFLKNIDNGSGVCTVGVTSAQTDKGFRGGGNLVILVFESLEEGESQVTISNLTANELNGRPARFQIGNARIIVR